MPTVQVIGVRDIYKKKRVAAYARVSTQKENQEDSFETQVKYYETLIRSNPNWTFTKVYSDDTDILRLNQTLDESAKGYSLSIFLYPERGKFNNKRR